MHKAVAVVGIGCIFPDAMDVSEYWSNILYGKDSIREIPDSFWKLDDYYDKDPKKKDKTYSKKAATVGDIPFNSIEFGVMPADLESISVEQIFALVTAKQALIDAGMYGENAKEFDHEKVGVIMAAGMGKTAFSLNTRLQIPKFRKILRNSGVSKELTEKVLKKIEDAEIDWTENSNPGYLPNVVAGRVASRFNLYGTNCTVDAACASSLAALKFAIDELENGDCDTVLAGATNLDCSEFSFVSFSKTPAISHSDRIMPFNENADGMILGDGVGMVVLKLLDKAEADGDRIYGVIKGIGASGDGRSKGIFAPSVDGQVKAMRRAYENAGIDKSTVSLIEAHGTGTKVGDEYEIESIKRYFGVENVNHEVGIGSVKSQIGHTRLAAGIASFIKVILSVYHKVLPITLHVEEPTKLLDNTSFNVINKSKPWIINKNNPVRRAGISAFGFGGTNYHVVVEEYKKEEKEIYRLNRVPISIVQSGNSKSELIEKCKEVKAKLLNEEELDYGKDIILENEKRIGFIFEDKNDAIVKLDKAIKMLSDNRSNIEIPGVFYRDTGLSKKAKIATLFLSDNYECKDMLCDLAINYPEVRESFTKADNKLIKHGKKPVSQIVYSLGLSDAEIKNELSNKVNKSILSAISFCAIYKILSNRGYKTNYFVSNDMSKVFLSWINKSITEEEIYEAIISRKVLIDKKDGNSKRYIEELKKYADVVFEIGSDELGFDNVINFNFTEEENLYKNLETALMKLRVLGFYIKKDKYYKKIDDNIKLKFKKGLITINPRLYRSKKKEQLVREAIYKNDNEEEIVQNEVVTKDIKKSDNLNEHPKVYEKIEKTYKKVSLNEIYKIQKTNAEALTYLFKSENSHLNFFGKAIKEAEKSNIDKKEIAKELCDLGNKNICTFKDYIKEQDSLSSLQKSNFVKIDKKEGMRIMDVTCQKIIDKPKKVAIKRGLTIVTADRDGAYISVTHKLEKEGFEPVILNIEGAVVNKSNYPVYTLRNLDEKSIKNIMKDIVENSESPLSGFIYISSLRNNTTLKLEEGFEYNKAIFIIAKYFYLNSKKDLGKNKFFINVIRVDGYLGTKGTSNNLAFAGLSGLSKSLCDEWEDTFVKTIDIDPKCSNEQVSKYVLKELLSGKDSTAEVGINLEGERCTLKLKEVEMREIEDNHPDFNDVILVTGGSGGITSKCIFKLAESYQCKFVILGRTKYKNKFPLGYNFKNKREVQEEVIKIMRKDKKKLTPKELSKKVNAYYDQVKIHDTISKLKKAGSEVLYYNCDVMNENEVEKVINDAEIKLGKITGFIHGAGILADKYIQNKVEEDFYTVAGTKVFGLESCLKNISIENMKFMIFFSSVAAFFGNKGQSDYAIGNEILNKMSYKIKKDYPSCKIVAVNWGPWDGGMINKSLKNSLEDRDISIIPIEVGINLFMELFKYKLNHIPQVVVYDKGIF